MLTKPLLSKLPSKLYDGILITLVALMYVAVCAEADMYVPAFPQMLEYFGVKENQIQLILSINFAGLCFAGLVTGPLSDSFGRRRVLAGGLLLFMISSAGCVYSNDFNLMLGWRLLQGIAASVPMVVGAATLLDRYPPAKAGQLIGFVNSIITVCMAGAPIVGAWLSYEFGWRANFVVILSLAIALVVFTLLLVEESLPEKNRKPLSFGSVFKDFAKLLKSPAFMGNTILVCFPFVAMVVFVSSLSVIFINHLGISLAHYGYYQAISMVSFVIFSLVSIKMIGAKGLDYTKNVGGTLALLGALCLFTTAMLSHKSPLLICFSMAVASAGGALMAGTFGMKAMEVFPEIKGAALAMMTAVRQSLVAGLVIVSQILFDGTIIPIAVIVLGYAVVGVVVYMMLYGRKTELA